MVEVWRLETVRGAWAVKCQFPWGPVQPRPADVGVQFAAAAAGIPLPAPVLTPAGDLCWAFNLSGHPAVTVPAGLLNGLPVGLQVTAAPHRDDLALAFAGLAQVRLPGPPVRWQAG